MTLAEAHDSSPHALTESHTHTNRKAMFESVNCDPALPGTCEASSGLSTCHRPATELKTSSPMPQWNGSSFRKQILTDLRTGI